MRVHFASYPFLRLIFILFLFNTFFFTRISAVSNNNLKKFIARKKPKLKFTPKNRPFCVCNVFLKSALVFLGFQSYTEHERLFEPQTDSHVHINFTPRVGRCALLRCGMYVSCDLLNVLKKKKY